MDIWAEQLANATSAYKAGDYTVKASEEVTKQDLIKYSINENLGEVLEKISNNDFTGIGNYIHIGKTSKFLSKLADIKPVDVYIRSDKARAVMISREKAKEFGVYESDKRKRYNHHALGSTMFLKALIRAEEPIIAMVADGDSKPGEIKTRVMFVTDLKIDNKAVVVFQDLRKKN